MIGYIYDSLEMMKEMQEHEAHEKQTRFYKNYVGSKKQRNRNRKKGKRK